jgi:hypothetical protein
MKRVSIPLSRRKLDVIFLVFFFINLTFITYIVDVEQLVIADPSRFDYPLWPPRKLVDLVHWYGRNFDPVLIARPAWWRATIWIDSLFFGPFYVFALYAFYKGRDFIRLPGILWAAVMATNVTIILFEEAVGQHATPHFGLVLMANLPWALFPVFVVWRLWKSEHPFTEEVAE